MDAPKLYVTASTRIDGGTALKGICPYCKQEHVHGGGKSGDDVRQFLGHRVSHCSSGPPNDGYDLALADEDGS